MEVSTLEARTELERFSTLWGLDRLARATDEDRLSNGELLQMYLACSVVFVRWSLVYKAMPDLSMSMDQLLQATRKAGHSTDASEFFRSRQTAVVAQLFYGAMFREAAKQTTLYHELHAVLEHSGLYSETLEVLAFHLVGASNLVAVVEDPQSPFVLERIPCGHREALVENLRRLHAKWAGNNAAQVSIETATMIVECDYPVLAHMEPHHIMRDLHRRKTPGAGSVSVKTKSLGSTRLVGVKTHVTLAWTSECERMWAEDPRFRRYKQSKGWQAFYPSRDTVLAYLSDMTAGDPTVVKDCKTMNSPELIQLANRLAPYVEADIFIQTPQGKDFLRAMSATATLQQIGSWSTLDVARRMIVAHHPDWQTDYSFAWNLDRTTCTEIAAYREHWPHLPLKLLAEHKETE